MGPVNALAQQIEEEWTDELASYFGRSPTEVAERVRPWFDFPNRTLKIELMDGSKVEFRWAIFIVNDVKRAIAVFTEHCGHHIYPYHEARIYSDGKLVYVQDQVSRG